MYNMWNDDIDKGVLLYEHESSWKDEKHENMKIRCNVVYHIGKILWK